MLRRSEPRPSEPVAPPVADSEEPAQIRVQISEEERIALTDQIQGDLEIARAVAAKRPEAAAMAEDQRQRWDTLQHYIDQASHAVLQQELRGASELALKARLLAEELQPN